MKQCQKGTFFVFLSAVLYSIGGLLIKLIPWNGISINGARSVIALVVIGGYLVVTGRRIYLNRWVFFGAVAVLCTSLFFCIATKLTTAANAIVLQFTAPVLVILISWFVLKKKPTKLDLITCFAVFSGVICFFLDSLSAGGTLGNCMALVSGLGYAGVFFLNKLLGDDSVLAVFWGTVFSVVIGIPYIINEEAFSLSIMGSLVMLGIFQTGLAFLCLVIGLRNTPPVTASLLVGIEPVLNPILVAIFYHETIGSLALLGACIVVGSVLTYNVVLSRQQIPVETIN